ncbi:MAG: hypothetical protein Q4D13_07985 [Erysipelotrichaceae bacterium]|nr:hypothetical protein [Erysipelotrichaceae bacterium]
MSKKTETKKYNSWFAVIWYSFLETVTAMGNEADLFSIVEAKDHLGELGIKRLEKVNTVLMIIMGIICTLLGIYLYTSGSNAGILLIGFGLVIFIFAYYFSKK